MNTSEESVLGWQMCDGSLFCLCIFVKWQLSSKQESDGTTSTTTRLNPDTLDPDNLIWSAKGSAFEISEETSFGMEILLYKLSLWSPIKCWPRRYKPQLLVETFEESVPGQQMCDESLVLSMDCRQMTTPHKIKLSLALLLCSKGNDFVTQDSIQRSY